MQGVEDLLATTYMIGKAIAAISFPGMYRIYDFHSPNAPKLKNSHSFAFFGHDSDNEDDDNYQVPDISEYGHFFKVIVGQDIIYIENPLIINEAGWSPLHSCCMSFLTKEAGILLIDEIIRLGGSIDVKTVTGPGSFNRGWSPLHMACAYGVEPIVQKLIKAGANLNNINSYGYTPLLEACHRGFVNIVLYLVNAGANVNYLPPEEQSTASPFIGSPPQSALGEAARSGFQRIAQHLIESGAHKDLQNHLGWTALHEACFYNRIETAKLLLLSGANACIRTRMGALPYHLAGLQVVRTMLADMGGARAVPELDDKIEMYEVLRELTMAETAIITDTEGNMQIYRLDSQTPNKKTQQQALHTTDSSSKALTPSNSTHTSNSNSKQKKISFKSESNDEGDDDDEDRVGEEGSERLLHDGPALGQLPSLSPANRSKLSPDKHMQMQISQQFDAAFLSDDRASPSPSRRADDKKPKRKKKGDSEEVSKDMPRHFLCALSNKPMTEPVKSTYGHVFEKSVIMQWLSQQGRICPLTGAPLSEINLKPMDELAQEIRSWLLAKGSSSSRSPKKDKPSNAFEASELDNVNATAKTASAVNAIEEDLYDF